MANEKGLDLVQIATSPPTVRIMNYAIYAAKEAAQNLGKAKNVSWKEADSKITFKTNIKENDLVMKSDKVIKMLKKG